MTNVPLFLGTDLSYLVLVVVFGWIAFGVGTYLHYRKKWMSGRPPISGSDVGS